MKFTIGPDGTVQHVEVMEGASNLPDPKVGACIAARFENMQFPEPKPKGVVIVSYPFVSYPE